MPEGRIKKVSLRDVRSLVLPMLYPVQQDADELGVKADLALVVSSDRKSLYVTDFVSGKQELALTRAEFEGRSWQALLRVRLYSFLGSLGHA